MPRLSDEQLNVLEEFLNKGSHPYDFERKVLVSKLDLITANYDGLLVPPQLVEIQSTSVCNFPCLECIGKKLEVSKVLGGTQIEDGLMERIVDDVCAFEVGDFRVEEIKFSGICGEPLLASSTKVGIRRALELKQKRKEQKRGDLRVGLFTNGSKLGSIDYLEDLLKIDYIHVSFYHHLAVSGLKQLVLNNIRYLVGKRDRSNSNTKITVGLILREEDDSHNLINNYLGINDYLERFKEIGVDSVRCKADITSTFELKPGVRQSILSKANRTGQYIDEPFFDIHMLFSGKEQQLLAPKLNSCYAHFFMSTVASDAHVYPCDHAVAGRFRMGDLRKESFQDIWKRKQDAWQEKHALPVQVGQGLCEICPPYPHRLNPFLDMLHRIYKSNPGSLSALSEAYKKGIRTNDDGVTRIHVDDAHFLGPLYRFGIKSYADPFLEINMSPDDPALLNIGRWVESMLERSINEWGGKKDTKEFFFGYHRMAFNPALRDKDLLSYQFFRKNALDNTIWWYVKSPYRVFFDKERFPSLHPVNGSKLPVHIFRSDGSDVIVPDGSTHGCCHGCYEGRVLKYLWEGYPLEEAISKVENYISFHLANESTIVW